MKKRPVLYQYILSFGVLFCLLIVPLGFSCLHSISLVRDDTVEHAAASLRRKQETIQLHMDEITALVNNLSLNARIVGYAYATPDTPQYYDKMRLALEELSNASLTNEFIHDIALYHHQGQKILTTTGIYDLPKAWKFVMPFEGEDYETWLALLEQKPPYVAARKLMVPAKTEILRTYRTFPNYLASSQDTCTLIVMINADILKQELQDEQFKESCTYILDKDQSVLLHTGNEAYLLNELPDLAGQDYTTVEHNGKKLFVTRAAGKQDGWAYVFVSSEKELMQPVYRIQFSLYALIAVVSLLGLMTVFVLARYNYKPIQDVALSLQKIQEIPPQKNELEYISHVTNDTIHQIDDLSQRLNAYYPVLQDNAYYQLLQASYEDIAELTSSMEELDIHFAYDNFLVLLFELVDDSDAAEQRHAAVKFSLKSMLEKELAPYGSAIALSVEPQLMAVLFNYQEPESGTIVPALREVLQKIHQRLRQEYPVSLGTGISAPKQSLQHVHTAYIEAKHALEYNNYPPSHWYHFWDEVKDNRSEYIYRMENDQILMSALKTGDRTVALKALESIIEDAQQGRSLSLEAFRYLFYNLIVVMLRIVGTLDISVTQIFGEKDPMQLLASSRSASELYDAACEITLRLCDYFAALRAPRNETVLTKMIDYIAENYANPDLSLSMMADAFGFTPSYIAHFLRQQGSNTFLNLLRDVRVGKAKELLQTTDLTIREIAQQVGYADPLVLNRNFKKIVLVTPGQYREQSKC